MNWTYTEKEWEEYAKSNKIIFSSCENCVFFTSPDTCSCGRLEKFKDIGVSVIEVQSNDKQEKHKVINGRICNMYRTEDWAKATKISQGCSENVAREEIRLQCTFIILCPDDKELNEISDKSKIRSKSKEKISRIVKTMKSIDSSKVSPKEIILINESCIKPYDFVNYLRIQSEEAGIKCKWRLEHFGNDEKYSEEDIFIKNILKTVKTGYCSVFYENEIVPQNYLSSIDNLLNDELKAFMIIKPEKGLSGIVINSILVKQFFGNSSKGTLEEFFKEVEKVTKEQKCQHLIQSLDKVLQHQE